MYEEEIWNMFFLSNTIYLIKLELIYFKKTEEDFIQ